MPALIYTDSLMNPIARSMHYQEGYIGGCTTNEIFRNNNSGLCYYRSPSDSLAILDEDGKVHTFIVFDFLDKAISQKAKTDYLAFRRSKPSADYLRLVNSPIVVSDSTLI
jgi:hypothetical protein